MRTARPLTISPNILCARGVCLLPEGCWSGGGLVWAGVSAPGGVPGLGGVPRGGSGPVGWYPSMHWGRPPPPVNRITHACENITLPNFVAGGNNNYKVHTLLNYYNCKRRLILCYSWCFAVESNTVICVRNDDNLLSSQIVNFNPFHRSYRLQMHQWPSIHLGPTSTHTYLHYLMT